MFFQKNVDNAFKKLHEESDYADRELYSMPNENDREQMPELEKNDFLAMLIAAVITFVPVALIAMAILGIMFFVFLR